MTTVGPGELRQDASGHVRRVEDRKEKDIADLTDGRPDPDWERDRDLVDQSIASPWKYGDECGS